MCGPCSSMFYGVHVVFGRLRLQEIDAGTLLLAPGGDPNPLDLSFKAGHASALVGKKEESARSGRASSRLPAIGRPRTKQVGIGRDRHSRAWKTRYRALFECNATVL
ncbi:hypothetical protein MRX96_041166 [Rhipicephalus microplus]